MKIMIYYNGGNVLGYWVRSLVIGESEESLKDSIDQLIKMGIPAMAWDITTPVPKDPPEWWDFTTLRRKSF